jgi:hypothetical protein
MRQRSIVQIPKQIEYWARIGKAVLEDPYMPLQLIQETLLCCEEANQNRPPRTTEPLDDALIESGDH